MFHFSSVILTCYCCLFCIIYMYERLNDQDLNKIWLIEKSDSFDSKENSMIQENALYYASSKNYHVLFSIKSWTWFFLKLRTVIAAELHYANVCEVYSPSKIQGEYFMIMHNHFHHFSIIIFYHFSVIISVIFLMNWTNKLHCCEVLRRL